MTRPENLGYDQTPNRYYVVIFKGNYKKYLDFITFVTSLHYELLCSLPQDPINLDVKKLGSY